jgi:ArsR family transcriptional regulator
MYYIIIEVISLEKDYGSYTAFMKALSDETRLRIFDMLSAGELCACKILEEFHITQPTLSYHMKILCESGLVFGRKDGIWMKYSLNQESLDRIKELFEGISDGKGTQRKCTNKCTGKC